MAYYDLHHQPQSSVPSRNPIGLAGCEPMKVILKSRDRPSSSQQNAGADRSLLTGNHFSQCTNAMPKARPMTMLCVSSLLLCACAEFRPIEPSAPTTASATRTAPIRPCPPCAPVSKPLPVEEKPMDGHHAPAVTQAFQSFFGENIPKRLAHNKTRIVAQSHYENPEDMPVTLQFSGDRVEKVLLLYVPHNGYAHDGLYHQSCAEQATFIAGYRLQMKPIRRMETRIRTNCPNHQLTLMLWVKTEDGYQLDTANCNTTVASHVK